MSVKRKFKQVVIVINGVVDVVAFLLTWRLDVACVFLASLGFLFALFLGAAYLFWALWWAIPAASGWRAW